MTGKPSPTASPVPPKFDKKQNLLSAEERDAKGAYSLVSRKFPRKVILFGGRKITLYSIAWLGAMSEKSPRTIHAWEREGNFPKPLFALKDGNRWYCASELYGYSRIIKAVNLRPGRYADGKTATFTLKTHSFQFQSALKKMLKGKLKDVPDKLVDEDDMLKALRRARKIKLSQETIHALIKP